MTSDSNVVKKDDTDRASVLRDQEAQAIPANVAEAGSAGERAIPSEHTEESARQQRIKLIGRRRRWKRRLENWAPLINAFVAVIGVIVAALTLFVLAFQLKLMDRQTEVMNSQTGVMNAQTGVMEKGLTVSEQSLHAYRVSERAYVGVASLKANLEAAQIVIMLQNIGSIPAPAITAKGKEIRVTPSTSLGTTGSGETVNESVEGTEFWWEAGEVQLFPGTPIPVVVAMQRFTTDEVNAILSKKEILYVGGTIEYGDGFGNRDSTTFAFKYNPPPTDSWTAHSDLSKFFKQQQR